MAHMGIYSGNHEIVEIEEEELNHGENYRCNNFTKPDMRREEKHIPLTSNDGSVSSIEEDLNQLFEIFNRKASQQTQAGKSKKKSSKKPAKEIMPHSPGHGISERVNLKQALRGLCLSQASEMAAMRRSTKSPRSSEAGKISTMYRDVVVENVNGHSRDDSREGLLELSLMPEQTTFPASDLWPSNRSSLADKVNEITNAHKDRFSESKDSSNQMTPSSVSSHADYTVSGMGHSTLTQNQMIMTSTGIGNQISESERQKQILRPSSPSQSAKISVRENGKSPAFVEYASQTPSTTGNPASPISSPNYVKLLPVSNDSVAQKCSDDFHDKKPEPRTSWGKATLEIPGKMSEQKEIIPVSPKEEHTPTRSPRNSGLANKGLEYSKNTSSPSKAVSKEVTAMSPRVVPKEKAIAIVSSTSPKGKKVSRSTKNAQHLVKPLIKTKNFVKRRAKKKTATENSPKNIQSEFHNDLYSNPNPIVCPRCQCNVTDVWKEANSEASLSLQDSPSSPQESLVSIPDSPVSPFADQSSEANSGNVVSEFSTPEQSSDVFNKSNIILPESNSNSKSKSRDKTEFTQSSKSSPDECSSSTSISEESNMSRPSFCDRPHMSKDVRWEAIRHVRFQHGTLGLRNFSLLKKLGCGDIGTVYLAELIGTNCLFAIKVMDCEFLARRKKITRAQTEKEILRMLDHPFLPTLYCQFTSDNLSCLVMEYCPGGDLHVLRQKQPGRCFTEQAARFYVAEVLLALEYLHMLGVIYRDLKPENILVREDGHIMLSDFDLSLRCSVSPTLLVSSSMSDPSRKIPRDDARCAQPLCIEPSCRVTCFTPKLSSKSSKLKKTKSDIAAEMRPLLQLVAEPTTARSNSFVGTHEYLAPEIIKGEGHGSAVDWWTFGIFLYELLYGRTPFKGPGNEETLANVVLQKLKFPDSPLVSLQARDLIDALLVKEPENRLGTERGAAEIKQHPFFDGLNWALIRCAVPPELPESGSLGMPKPIPGEKNNKSSEFEVF